MMETLSHIIYSSAAAVEFSQNDLIALLKLARDNNHGLNITGVLLYDDKNFFQVLEGADAKINTLYQKIEADPRHKNVIKIISEPIHLRTFDQWSMGFIDLSLENSSVAGKNDFFSENSFLQDLDDSRSRKILDAFRKGFWRNAIQ